MQTIEQRQLCIYYSCTDLNKLIFSTWICLSHEKQITWIKPSCLGNSVSSFPTPSIYHRNTESFFGKFQFVLCSAWPWAWIPANYWWSLSSLSLGGSWHDRNPGSVIYPPSPGEFLHDLNGMEQKLLEPPYKSQWQYKVLDLNTHKINDQVGIQHAYIIRFLQLKKKHIQSYAEHLVKSAHVSTLSIGKNWVPQTESGSPCHWYST